MAIDAYGNTLGASSTTTAQTSTVNPNSVLGKDDFLKLLLLELKYQDPTAPMDSEKILSQTSQLAALEASENTNKALSDLAASLTSSLQYSGISAIGKIAVSVKVDGWNAKCGTRFSGSEVSARVISTKSAMTADAVGSAPAPAP